MITDARVLQEDFVPADVVHRNAEINHLSTALEPLVEGGRPETAFLLGPTGAGKTCIARYTVGRLREQSLDVRTQYVNCWQDYTRFAVLYRLLEGIDRAVDVHRRSTPTDELFDRLAAADDTPLVAVLDEVDQLEATDVLYDLHRLPHVTMVLISNREADLFAGLDDRVRSRLTTGTRIQFDRYALDELAAILRKRVDKGLAPGAIDDAGLERIADAAAGDARVGLGIIRSAARIADREGTDRIDDDTIERAIPTARESLQQETVDRLTDHQRTVYAIVDEAGEIAPGDLYDRYCERVDDPKTKRTMRNYLEKMVHYDLVEAVGEKRGRRYRVVDPTAGE